MFRKLLDKYKNISIQVRASFWFLISGFLSKGISVITTPIFTRILTTKEYGQFSVFNSWYGIVSVIVSLNLYCGVYSKGIVKFSDRRKEFISSIQGLCFTLVMVWTAVYLVTQQFWNRLFSLTTIQMLAMLAIIWLSAAFQFWAVDQRVDFKYKTLVIVTLINTIVQPLLGIFLVLHSEDKVTARIIGILISDLFFLYFFAIQLKQGKKFFSKEFWKYALIFNIPLIPHYLSLTVLNSADRIMIANMIGDNEAGIYNLAYSISQIMTIFNTALLQTFEPWLYKKIKAKQIGDISGVVLASFILVAGVNILLMLFAPEVIAIFAPVEYREAIWVIPPIAMSVFFMYVYTFFAVFEFYYEKTMYTMLATFAGAVLNILLNGIFIKIFGYYATGYTTLVCYALFAVLHYICMKKMCHDYLDDVEPYDKRSMFFIMISFVISGFLILFTYQYLYVRYFIIIILVMIIFVKRKKILQVVMNIVQIKSQNKK